MSQRIQDEGISCLLAEPGFDEALARRAFAGRVASFTSVDEFFVAVPFDGKGYEAGLTQMADAIYHCLGGH
jgi:ABC-type Zn2+ transport system substrate-binding protein/surface adhesin